MRPANARESLPQPEMSAQPWRQVAPAEAQWMRPHIEALLGVMAEGVRQHVPEYARPGDRNYEPQPAVSSKRRVR